MQKQHGFFNISIIDVKRNPVKILRINKNSSLFALRILPDMLTNRIVMEIVSEGHYFST